MISIPWAYTSLLYAPSGESEQAEFPGSKIHRDRGTLVITVVLILDFTQQRQGEVNSKCNTFPRLHDTFLTHHYKLFTPVAAEVSKNV